MNHISRRKLTIVRGLLVGIVIIFLYFHAKAGTFNDSSGRVVSAAIKIHLSKHKLNYPHSVERFYKQTAFKMAWVAPDTVKMHALDAMSLLDCVRQYGFDHRDFHPHELIYDQLHSVNELNSKVEMSEKALFDVLLTDAIITFVNDLHYGKMNPEFPASKIDQGNDRNFNASKWLINSMSDQDFVATLLSAQPKLKMYRDLQDLMRLMTAQNIGDGYEVPAGQIRKVAVNMERLRCLNNAATNYMTINVPSNSLWYHNDGHIDRFKVDLNLPVKLLPMVETTVVALWTGTQFSIRQRKPVPSKGLLILDFQNDFHSYFPIGDHSRVFVKHGQRLAELILYNDGSAQDIQRLFSAMNTGTHKRFFLKTAVPIKIIYITCEMKEGILVQYPDPYHLDKPMENALYKVKMISIKD